MCQLRSTVTETGNIAVGSHVVQQFIGGHKCKLLSRSSLFIRPNSRHDGTLLAAYGDETSHSVSKITARLLTKIICYTVGAVVGYQYCN